MNNPENIELVKQWLGSGSINIFGRPFAGKDTQGRLLAEIFGGVLLSGGEIIRQSNIPQDTKATMRAGKLIPTDQYIKIVLPYLSQEEFADKPLFLSSVGRWAGEEDSVIIATQESGHPLKAVIHLVLDEVEVEKRWQALRHLNDRGSRHDDTLDILKVRLEEYKQKTLPVLKTYSELGVLIEVNANQSVEDVTKDILTGLLKMSK